jgi:hypothetical protein
MEERVPRQGHLTLEPRVAFPCELVRQDGQRLPLVVLFLQAGQRVLHCWMMAQEQRCGLGKGPREVSMPHFFAGRAQACARRCFGPLHQATRGDTSLPPGEAGNVRDVIEPYAAEHLADTGHSLPEIPRVGVMRFGGLAERECHVAQELVLRGEKG